MMPVAPSLMGTGVSTPPDSVPHETSVQVPTSLSLSDCPCAALETAARQRASTIEPAIDCEIETRISTSDVPNAARHERCAEEDQHHAGELPVDDAPEGVQLAG